MKIRTENDIVVIWGFILNAISLQMETVKGLTVNLTNFRGNIMVFHTIDAGKIRIELTSAEITNPGIHNLTAQFEIADSRFSDGFRKITIDIDAFEAVPKSAEADDVHIINLTTVLSS